MWLLEVYTTILQARYMDGKSGQFVFVSKASYKSYKTVVAQTNLIGTTEKPYPLQRDQDEQKQKLSVFCKHHEID